MRRFFFASLTLFALAACGTDAPKPVGVGSGVDDLRRSPCSKVSTVAKPCAPVQQHWEARI